MADREELRESALTRYSRDFDTWLYDFKETDTYAAIVADYEECWREIYKELDRIFKEKVWNPMKLTNKNEVSTNQHHQRRSSDNEQLNNYRREFDKWLNDFKKTDAYGDIVDGYEECWSEIYKELHRIFKENVWYPKFRK